MRLVISIFLSVVVTLALFWFMQYLISGGDDELQKPEERMTVEIVRVKQEEEVREREREPPQPPDPQERPPPPPMDQMQTNRPTGGPGISTPQIETGVTGGLGMGTMQEGDPVPVAAIPPQYPRDALMQGVEGWVRVEFIIEADGSVSNPRVVDAHPRRGIFDREAIRAISRWRFRPRVRDGEPEASRAGYTIEFTMDDN